MDGFLGHRGGVVVGRWLVTVENVRKVPKANDSMERKLWFCLF